MELLKNKDYEITITGMTSEGNGVGRIGDFAVFVPDTAPGETCLIKLVQKRNSYGFGKLLEVLSPSPERVDPDCSAFPRCGGCVYRHLSYKTECEAKEQVVRDAFARLGHIDTPVSPIIGSAREAQYRNKAQYPFGIDKNGNVICGFYARRSHRIIPCENCALHSPLFEEVRATVCKLAAGQRIPIYNEEMHKGLLRHLYLRMAEKTGELMVCFVATRAKYGVFKPLADALMKRFPQITSVILNVNPDKTNVILGEECITLAGNDTITDILCDVKIELSPLSFYQVNRDQAEVLYEKALSFAALKPTDTLIDLYCGAGTIGLAAANRVKKMVGIEIVPEAIENAKRNAAVNGIENASFICADAGKAAAEFAKAGVKPDVIVVDPPRKGLDDVVISAIGTMAPSRLVMVSCNPSTAARDAALLQEQGYHVDAIVPVDMFPRTHHVECIVSFVQDRSVKAHIEKIRNILTNPDVLFDSARYSGKAMHSLASGHVSQTSIRFENEAITALVEANGRVEFYDKNGTLIAEAKAPKVEGGRGVYEQIGCQVEDGLLKLHFPICSWIDHYPNCDGEYDRWESEIVDFYIMTMDPKTGIVF